ncbi:MAG: hydrolase, partial [Caldilineaceae bacterium SB0668_bin_21]|nr:hydrolase [Caldilineaceae bacterium SB0668_bin_21]
MDKRLYYEDAYCTRFTAQVAERFTLEGKPAVRLSRSAFYPTSGGQPHDTGRLGGTG